MKNETLHYAHPTGFALALTSGVVYSFCALAIRLWPEQTVRFFNDWFHGVDLSTIFTAKFLTFGVFLRGLVEIIIFAYLAGLLYAFIYNKCVAHCKKRSWI
ncbi:MAG: DUF5676 family membrane protein [Nanoarchaeota archaeon]